MESVAGNDYYFAAASSAFAGERNPLYRHAAAASADSREVNYAAGYLSFGSSVSLEYTSHLTNSRMPKTAKRCSNLIAKAGINWRLRWDTSLSSFAR